MSRSLPKASLDKISSLFTEDVLLEIVRSATGDDETKITSYDVTYATAPGEGYLGIVYRVLVQVVVANEPRELSFIVKGMPVNLARRKTWKIPSFFKNEVLFYNTILPTLLKFEKKKRGEQAQVEKPFVPVPVCVKCHSDGDNDFIVMLDLGVEGFKISERTEGFNEEHCKAALQVLGYFHGLSLSFKAQEPENFKKMVQDMVEPYYRLDYESWYSGFLKNLQTVAIDAVSKEYPGSEYETKMRQFANEGQYKLMCELVKPVEPHAVPNHGDAWGPNFLYRYESTSDQSKPSATRLLDFQLMRYGPPVLDLLFFLYSVTTTEQRDHGGFDRLLRHYHGAMSEVISETGGDVNQIFSFETLLSEVKKYGKYGLGMGIESVPLSMVESEEVCDLDAIPGDQEVPLENYWKVPLIKSKENRLRVADLVKFTVDQGFI